LIQNHATKLRRDLLRNFSSGRGKKSVDLGVQELQNFRRRQEKGKGSEDFFDCETQLENTSKHPQYEGFSIPLTKATIKTKLKTSRTYPPHS
jgi:hypothetical protein